MSSILSTLSTMGNGLLAFEKSLEATQNNVSNSSTAGYARQAPNLQAMAFDPSTGTLGGVRSNGLISSRDEYAENAVRNQASAQGNFTQQASNLSAINSLFDITGNSGIPASLTRLMQNFSAWATSPGSSSARQAVIDSANQLSASFKQTASELNKVATGIGQSLKDTTSQINALAQKLAAINQARAGGGNADPSVDAELHSTLEELSSLTSVSVLYQPDGTVNVFAGGQTPLVMNDKAFAISVSDSIPAGSNASAPPGAAVFDANGTDVTSQISGGKLGGLLQVRNQVLPSLQGDSTQPGQLNQLAQSIADRVNGILTSGLSSSGPPPVPGVPLFTYDAANASQAAATFSVDQNVTANSLAAISTGTSGGSNGNALQLAGLSTSTDPADQIGGLSYLDFFAQMASTIGTSYSSAQANQTRSTQLLTQAQSMRSDISGVSLDHEAAQLIELQRGYQAVSKVVSVINDLAQSLLDMVK